MTKTDKKTEKIRKRLHYHQVNLCSLIDRLKKENEAWREKYSQTEILRQHECDENNALRKIADAVTKYGRSEATWKNVIEALKAWEDLKK